MRDGSTFRVIASIDDAVLFGSFLFNGEGGRGSSEAVSSSRFDALRTLPACKPETGQQPILDS